MEKIILQNSSNKSKEQNYNSLLLSYEELKLQNEFLTKQSDKLKEVIADMKNNPKTKIVNNLQEIKADGKEIKNKSEYMLSKSEIEDFQNYQNSKNKNRQ